VVSCLLEVQVQQEHQRTHTSRYQDRHDVAARPTSRNLAE
jgi:hypothetical protein